MPVGIDPEDVLVLAGGLPMLDMVRASSQSTAAADAPAELRLAAQKVTLTDAAAGSAVEVLYRMVLKIWRKICARLLQILSQKPFFLEESQVQ